MCSKHTDGTLIMACCLDDSQIFTMQQPLLALGSYSGVHVLMASQNARTLLSRFLQACLALQR